MVQRGVRIALVQIRVNKLKSFFTLLGVMIGVMFLIAVVSIVTGMGKAGIIGQKISATLSSTGTP